MKILVTSGGTKIPIDRVRSITNMSRGTFGSRIADAFFDEGLEAFRTGNEYGNPIEKITFFMAKGSKRPMLQSLNDDTYEDGYRPIEYVEYSTFDDYKSGIEDLLKKETYDIIVAAAAVSDYGVANYYNGKYRSRDDDMCIKLVKLPKVLPIMRKLAPNAVICGFKLLVDSTTAELLNAMKNQIVESDVDLVIGNDLRDIKNDDHILTVMSKHNATPREYSLPPPEERKRFAVVYPLAKAVVDECLKEHIVKKQNETKMNFESSDYAFCGYRVWKPGNSGVIYIPYIPKQIIETDEEREARVKRERTGKSYAKVKLSNSNPRYRCKRGEIVDKDPLTRKICLEIETRNSCSESGCMTLVAVPRSQYKKIWFDEDELTNFETYDENGELVK